MADLHIKVSSAWKSIDNAHVKVSNAWKQVDKIYVKVSNAWKEVWANFVVTLTGSTDPNGAVNTDNGIAWFGFNTDGTVTKYVDQTPAEQQISASTDWVIPNSAAGEQAFQIRWSTVSGDLPDYTLGFGSTQNNWVNLNTTCRIGTTSPSPAQLTDGIVKVDIGIGGVVLETGNYEFYGIDTTG